MNKRIGVIGDVHLAHPVVPTFDIISRAHLYFLPLINTLNLLVINGDWYDRPIPHDSKEAHFINLLICQIIKKCIDHNVILRVLRGTPSHDGDQCQNFITMYEAMQTQYRKDCDFKYIDTLTFEEINGIGLCLFMPDKFGSCPSDAYDQMYKRMESEQITQFDFAFMHGGFEFQLPYSSEAHPIHHDSEAYMDLVKNKIFINHIHTPSIFEKICAPGSFDRTRHGEEHRKGWTIYEYDEGLPAEGEFIFVENLEATLFTTLTFEDCEINSVVDRIHEIAAKHKSGHIRLMLNEEHPLMKHLKPIQIKFKQFTIKAVKKDVKKDIFNFKPKRQTVTLDRLTLPKLVLARIGIEFENRKKEIRAILNDIDNKL